MNEFMTLTTDLGVVVNFRISSIVAFFYNQHENSTAVFLGKGTVDSGFSFPNDHTQEIIEALGGMNNE